MDKILTVCPYCGSGCKLNLLVEGGEIVGAQPANGVTNQGELCLKGYYGWDFLNDTRLLTPRLTAPLLRRQRGVSARELARSHCFHHGQTENHQKREWARCHHDDWLLPWAGE